MSCLSPEILSGGGVGCSHGSDMWALGCILYELLTKQPPFDSGAIAPTVLAIERASPPPIPSKWSPGVISLVASLLEPNPGRRADISTILATPVISQTLLSVAQLYENI